MVETSGPVYWSDRRGRPLLSSFKEVPDDSWFTLPRTTLDRHCRSGVVVRRHPLTKWDLTLVRHTTPEEVSRLKVILSPVRSGRGGRKAEGTGLWFVLGKVYSTDLQTTYVPRW